MDGDVHELRYSEIRCFVVTTQNNGIFESFAAKRKFSMQKNSFSYFRLGSIFFHFKFKLSNFMFVENNHGEVSWKLKTPAS